MLASILTLLLSGCSEDSLKAGQESMQKEDYAAAVIHFKNAVQDQPNPIQVGLAQAQAGQHQPAITTLRTAVQLAPTKPSARLHLAEQLLAAGDRQEARAMLAQLNAGKLNAAQQAEHARLGQLLSK